MNAIESKIEDRKIWIVVILISAYLLLSLFCGEVYPGESPLTGEKRFDAGVAASMALELKQCRVTNEILREDEARLVIKDQIIEGKDELIKIKSDIISLKDEQIRVLKAVEVVKQFEDIISVQKGLIDELKPSGYTGIARFAMVVVSILTFGIIH
jgi:hypothetical protein